MMKKVFLSVLTLSLLVLPGPLPGSVKILYPSKDKKSGEKFYREVLPLVEQVIEGIVKKNGDHWKKTCNRKGIIFRYLGGSDLSLTCEEFGNLFEDSKKRQWGIADGSGEPIRGTFNEIFYENFLNAAKRHATRGINVFVQQGNAVNRLMDRAPFVDLTRPGSEKYGGMDWISLRLFFVKDQKEWFLQGLDLYHWTI